MAKNVYSINNTRAGFGIDIWEHRDGPKKPGLKGTGPLNTPVNWPVQTW